MNISDQDKRMNINDHIRWGAGPLTIPGDWRQTGQIRYYRSIEGARLEALYEDKSGNATPVWCEVPVVLSPEFEAEMQRPTPLP